MLEDALGDIGLSADEFWDMTWDEYDYAVLAHRNRIARAWEPTRELYALIYNMFADKADKRTAQELIPLFTDPALPTETGISDAEKAFFERMVANNFFQSPPPKPEKYDVN